jgi:hypothetical protein
MWIDSSGTRRSTVLGVRCVYSGHSGENLGLLVLEVFQDYGICGDRIGYFMLDSASSNDTAVDLILKELRPRMTPKHAAIAVFAA